jgi:hypothetical protein
MNIEDKFALAENQPEGGFVRVDEKHRSDLFVGTVAGGRALMLISQYQPPDPPALAFIHSEVRRRDDGKWALLLSLQRNDLKSLFFHLISDLVEATGSVPREEAPIRLVTRLSHWQKLLSRAPSGVLDDAELRGLIGELEFLAKEALPARQTLGAIQAWKGPNRATRDFQFPDVEVEVKAVTRSGKTVKISSIEQLSEAPVPLRLATVVVELFSDPLGSEGSVAAFVDEVRKSFEQSAAALELFETKLAAAGYVNLPAYDERYLAVGAHKFYEVRQGFPRINRPETNLGISAAEYEINIQSLTPFSILTWIV